MALSGRAVRIKRNGVTIAGAKTDGVTVNNDPLDITDKDDLGWRTMLADTGLRSISLDVEGVLKSDQLIDGAINADGSMALSDGGVYIENVGFFGGNFRLNNLQLGADQKDVVTFKATLASSGPIETVAPPVAESALTISLLSGDAVVVGATVAASWVVFAPADIPFVRQIQLGNSDNPADPSWHDFGSEYPSYTLTSAMVGKYVRYRATATNVAGSTSVYSNILGPVAAA